MFTIYGAPMNNSVRRCSLLATGSGFVLRSFLISGFLLISHLSLSTQEMLAQRGLSELGSAPVAKHIFEPVAKIAPIGNAGLFVGVNRFNKDNSLNDLAYAVNDAIELAYLFVFELRLIPPDNCVVLLSGTPSSDMASQHVREHLERLQRSGATIKSADRTEVLLSFLQVNNFGHEDSNILICSFCSHGFEDRGDAFIMPSDGVKRLLNETAIPLRTIETRMQESKAGHRLLLVDACQERISARSAQGNAPRSTEAFLLAFNKPTGQAKLASCSSGQLSHEYRDPNSPGHGLFTQGFLRALRGGAQPDDTGAVRLGAVAEYVSTFASDWTSRNGRQKQSPTLSGPVSSRQLPLAIKSGDLTTLLSTFMSQKTSSAISGKLKTELLNYLYKSSFSDPRDQQLVDNIRKHVKGEISGDLLSAYIDRDRIRWSPKASSPKPSLLQTPFTESEAHDKKKEWSSYLGVPASITNFIGMKMQLIPPGTFIMGANERENERSHRVTLTKPLYVSNFEVTVGQFQQFAKQTGFKTGQELGGWQTRGWDVNRQSFTKSNVFSWKNTGWPQQENHPVVNISWKDGQRFVDWINKEEDEKYRFLTEAEWEYCCRAGTTSLYSVGNNPNHLVNVGNILDQTGMRTFSADHQFSQNNQNVVIPRNDGIVFTAPVGSFRANAFGLYDFHGNICEWCNDWFTESYHQLTPEDPQGSVSGSQRVARGGRFDTGGGLAKSFRRNQGNPTTTDMILGLRLAREIKVGE